MGFVFHRYKLQNLLSIGEYLLQSWYKMQCNAVFFNHKLQRYFILLFFSQPDTAMAFTSQKISISRRTIGFLHLTKMTWRWLSTCFSAKFWLANFAKAAQVIMSHMSEMTSKRTTRWSTEYANHAFLLSFTTHKPTRPIYCRLTKKNFTPDDECTNENYNDFRKTATYILVEDHSCHNTSNTYNVLEFFSTVLSYFEHFFRGAIKSRGLHIINLNIKAVLSCSLHSSTSNFLWNFFHFCFIAYIYIYIYTYTYCCENRSPVNYWYSYYIINNNIISTIVIYLHKA